MREMLQASCTNGLVDILGTSLTTYRPREVNHVVLKLTFRGDGNEMGPQPCIMGQAMLEVAHLKTPLETLEKPKEEDITLDEALVQYIVR